MAKIPSKHPGLPFKFELIPTGQVVEFEAYIKTINDRFSPQWETSAELGRADHKILYNRFVREIDINFVIVALEKGEPKSNFQKLNDLTKSVYPRYIENYGFQGNFVKFTIGGMFKDEVGYVITLQNSVNNEETTWDLSEGLPLYSNINMVIGFIGKEMPDSEQTKAYSLSGGNGGGGGANGPVTQD